MLKQIIFSIVLLSGTFTLANTNFVASNDSDRETLSITIYNESLALVNETRKIPLKAGLNNVELKDVSAQIRAETALIASLSNAPFRVIEQNFDYDLLSPQTLLNKAVGNKIEIIHKQPTTGEETRESAILLSNNGQPVLQFKDRIEIGNFSNFAFTSIPEGLRDRPTLSILLNSDSANNNNIQLTYLTGGFSWQADYTATLSSDEKSMDLSGLITLNNKSGTTFNNAELQLVAGDINQVSTRRRFDMKDYGSRLGYKGGEELREGSVTQEKFGDYHLYTLPFATDLKNNQTKQVALLSTQNVPVEKEYRFNQNYNYITKDGENLKASVLYHINNKKESQLGIPLPKGIFRIYKNDSSGNALLLGEARIQHIAENEEFIINTGNAFDISLTKTLIEEITVTKDIHQYTYQVVFNNAKDEEITVNYLSNIPYQNWDILKTSHPSTEKDARTVQWIIEIPAKEQATLTYTLQVSAQ